MKNYFYTSLAFLFFNLSIYAQLTQTVSTTATVGELSGSISVPKFNSHTGILLSADITITVTNAGKNNLIGAENIVASPATATVRKYLEYELNIPNTTGGTITESVTGSLVNTFARTYSAYDGTTDFAGTSGFTRSDNALNNVYTYSGDIAAFNSNDGSSIDVVDGASYSLNTYQTLGGGGNISASYVTLYDFIVDVTYTYSSTLPVTFVSFTGYVANDNTVNLNWVTTEEEDIDYYNLEYSHDGQQYETIGIVMAKSTATENSYSFAHLNNNQQIAFYRLKYVEKSGKIEYSKTIRVSLKNNAVGNYIAYPNPVRKSQGQISISGNLAAGTYFVFHWMVNYYLINNL